VLVGVVDGVPVDSLVLVKVVVVVAVCSFSRSSLAFVVASVVVSAASRYVDSAALAVRAEPTIDGPARVVLFQAHFRGRGDAFEVGAECFGRFRQQREDAGNRARDDTDGTGQREHATTCRRQQPHEVLTRRAAAPARPLCVRPPCLMRSGAPANSFAV
jgi:hypothetical protein